MNLERTKNSNSLANKVFPDISNTPTNELGDRDIQLLLKTGYVEKPQYFGEFEIIISLAKSSSLPNLNESKTPVKQLVKNSKDSPYIK